MNAKDSLHYRNLFLHLLFLREVFLFSSCYSLYNSFLFYTLAAIDINALIYIIAKEG